MEEISGIGKTYRRKLTEVLKRHHPVITAKIVSEILKVSLQESGRLLSRWCKNGWIYRIKRGAYVPVPLESSSGDVVIEDPLLIADSLYGPGYIGGFSAVKHWDFSEQIFETVTYFSRKKIIDRTPIHGGISFKIKTISDYKIFGLKTLWLGSKKLMVSDPTKTIIDLFDDPKLVGGFSIVADIFSEYRDSESYDFNLMIEYALKMKNRTIFKRMGFLLEVRFDSSDYEINQMLDKISTGLSELDPITPSRNVIKRWQLKVPSSWKKEYDRKK